MAKRRRLNPPRLDYFRGPDAESSPLGLPGSVPPPISRIAGDAAAAGALREVAEEMTAARNDGRFLLRLPLDRIDETWLVRDRIGTDPEALENLMSSLRSHGQRNPIEVTEIAPDRYGLISGWRRLTALRRLHADLAGEPEQARFATVLALPRQPETAEDAYVAMVEENEIRLGLSYFERARIAAKAVEAGVFETEKLALRKLYASASRAKRSKIGSFLRLYHLLQDHLRFASALPERLGLALARALDADPALGGRIAGLLDKAAPDSAEQEQALLQATLKKASPPQTKTRQGAAAGDEIRPGIVLRTQRPASDGAEGKVTLTGKGLTPEMLEKLRHWLSEC
ncbi:ParB/RepB/Spo0J family partition protein [Sulfitobacter sabulilitoris]|uniref:Nuclease n=1 Tax=Sulfitobacter sabulilitoris TaxID=2562655 RepID=A0A5S3P7B7_9RHOB|nr:ParB N-terminal domain-containing protein [Sulfitobacter sabulilitoris]TMM49160.1 nuclease [Sulfitobacter sabulilitoris]